MNEKNEIRELENEIRKTKIVLNRIKKHLSDFKKKDFVTFSIKNKKADFFLEKKSDKIIVYEEKEESFPVFFKELHSIIPYLKKKGV